MKKYIFRFIVFLLVCLFISTLSVDLAHAKREASMRLEIPQIYSSVNVIMKDIAASATRFYLLYSGTDPEKKVRSNIKKVYVFDHEGTRRPDEEFELDTKLTPHSIAVTDKLVYISYFSYSHIDAYDFDGRRLHHEDVLHAYGGREGSIAATETHLITSDVGYYPDISIYKFKETQGDANGKAVSFEKSCKLTTSDAEGVRAYVAATDTRVYIHHPYDSTIYVYDVQDGGRRAREDFNNGLWHGKAAYANVPSRIVSGITTTPLGGKLFLLMSQRRTDGKRGYGPVIYRYSIPEETAERPMIDLPAKPPRTASYYFHIPWSGSGIAATDTNVYVAAGSGLGGLYGKIYSAKHSDGVPGSLYADSGKQAVTFSLHDHYLYSEAMTVDYHNIYILRKHYFAARSSSFSDNPGSAYSVRFCSLNSEASVPNGATKLIDLELPIGMENFGRGIGLAIDSEGILYVMDSGENRKGAPRIYRYKPSLSHSPNSRALPGNPITLHPDHKYPCGITIVKNRAYVLDRDYNFDKGRPDVVAKIFVYTLDGADVFEYLPEESFSLNVGPIHPVESGIAINGDTFFISMRSVGASSGRDVFVYGPPAAPSWNPIRAETIQDRQSYSQDLWRMSRSATDDEDLYRFQAIEGVPWLLSIDSDFVFGNPKPTITFKSGYTKPEWLTLKNNALSGTPSPAGKYVIELTATNEHGSVDNSFTLNVAPALVAAGWRDFTVPEVRINDAWSLSLKDWVTGNPRPGIIFAAGYTPPDWLELQNGVLSGTPVTAGIFPIQLTAAAPIIRPGIRSWADLVIHLVVRGPTSPNWLLDASNDTAHGIAATEKRVYVVDFIDDKIYVYGHDGKRYVTEDINLNTFTDNPIGITATATNIYILDNKENIVSIFDATGTVPVSNFQLLPDNQAPSGIAATATRLYVVDNEDDKIYVYGHEGTQYPTEDVNLSSHREPTGITASPTRLYVVDGDTDNIYAYSYDGKLQSREIIELVSENRSPTGITATSSHLFVVDILDQKVYSYPILGAIRDIISVGAPSWKSVSVPRADLGVYWTFSLAALAKGDPTPLIEFTEGYTPPDWLTLQNGVLSGTPTKAETVDIQITATNSKGSAHLTFPLPVLHPEGPSWDINPTDQTVKSIANTKTHVYVLHSKGYNTVPYISTYTHDGIRRTDKDIKLGNEHIGVNYDICASDTQLYLLVIPLNFEDPTSRSKVHVFDLTGTGVTKGLDLSQAEDVHPWYITATERRFFLYVDKKVYVYGNDGTPYPNENFSMDYDLGRRMRFKDMAATEKRLYMTVVLDHTYDRQRVYVYGHDGTPYPNENFNIGELMSRSITATSTHLMVCHVALSSGPHAGSIFLLPLPNIGGIAETVVQHQDTIPAWDVNQDGQVNIQDLIEVAQYIGETERIKLRADVNRDGTVDVQDLLIVSQHLGESTDAAAPFRTRTERFPVLVKTTTNSDVNAELIQTWIDLARIADNGSLVFKRGIANLERLLADMLPNKTELLANYPNPFNPETWIPYRLAKTAEVQITIYNIYGTVVRQLDLGQKPAGNYAAKSRAAHWDGHNADGEKVASGIYFYQLRAGGYEHTRRMLIVK